MSDAIRFERTPDGRRLTVSRVVQAPADSVWDLLVDARRWPEWGPSVRDVECDDHLIQPGSTGRVKTPVGIWLPFEIVSCEPYRWTWRVAGVPATGHRIEVLSEESCRVIFELSPIAVVYVPVCQRALRAIVALVE